MEPDELISKYERIHSYFMDDPRFWYEKGRMEADKIICVLASDLRKSLREQVSPGRGRAVNETR